MNRIFKFILRDFQNNIVNTSTLPMIRYRKEMLKKNLIAAIFFGGFFIATPLAHYLLGYYGRKRKIRELKIDGKWVI